MHHLDPALLFGLLALMLASAKLFGLIAQRFGQPSVLGELIAGILIGKSALGWIDPSIDVIHLISELGVVLLLFAIGLETDLERLIRVGLTSTAVAIVGVILPFALGYFACRMMGLANLPALVIGASLTATSVGITARVLGDLGHLQEPEGRIVLGAAVLDDVVGLVILTVVSGLAEGGTITAPGVARIVGSAFGFLIAVIVVGKLAIAGIQRIIKKPVANEIATPLALMLALGLAWLAHRCGSAPIIGAFAAGLLVHGSRTAHQVEEGTIGLGQFFVPIFFVSVGAAVDVRVLNPMIAANWPTLGIGAVLIVAAVVGKFAAGYAPFWFRGNRAVIGVGMIPRGEVGLIFAQMGLRDGVFDGRLFGAVTMMVLVTTLMAPPLLKMLLAKRNPLVPLDPSSIDELVTRI